MKILLSCEFYYPTIGGAQEIIRQIAQRLAKKGHKVTVATSYNPERNFEQLNGVKIQSFKIHGNKVKGIWGEINRYKDFLVTSDFDVIANYAAQTWTTDLTFDVLEQIKAKKILIPCGYSGLVLRSKKMLYWNYFRKLPDYLRKYDHIIYHSTNYIDKAFGDKHGITHYSVIPNAIDKDEMQSHEIEFRKIYNIKTKYMLFNVSNHYKLKNHFFTIKAFDTLNRDDATLIINGNKPSSKTSCYPTCAKQASNKPKLLLLDSIPREHVVSAFHEADVFILGSKVEYFPLVILESMAVGLPFISTNVGCVKDFSGGIIISSIKEMAENITEILDNPDYRSVLSAEGRNECLNKFTWQKIFSRYENLFKSLLSEK